MIQIITNRIILAVISLLIANVSATAQSVLIPGSYKSTTTIDYIDVQMNADSSGVITQHYYIAHQFKSYCTGPYVKAKFSIPQQYSGTTITAIQSSISPNPATIVCRGVTFIIDFSGNFMEAFAQASAGQIAEQRGSGAYSMTQKFNKVSVLPTRKHEPTQ